MKIDAADDRKATAYHESGHAIAARALGSTILMVEIEPEPHAHCAHRNQIHRAIVALAGDIAEQRAVPGLGCADVDFQVARDVAEYLAPATASELLEAFRAQARALLDARWPDVASIADALITRGKLTGEEIDLICEGQSGRP
jgi:ATP-dependent Zn protease